MKVFIGHSFSEELDPTYYDFIKKVYKIVYDAGAEILVGGLFVKLKDDYKLWEDRLTVYTIPPYQDSLKYAQCKKNVVDTVLDRTKCLIEESDVVVLLPGGSGTLEELLACLEMYKAKSLSKKIYLLNHDNHFEPILNYLKFLEQLKFNKTTDLTYIEVINSSKLEKILKEGMEYDESNNGRDY